MTALGKLSNLLTFHYKNPPEDAELIALAVRIVAEATGLTHMEVDAMFWGLNEQTNSPNSPVWLPSDELIGKIRLFADLLKKVTK